jgi:hypothetical protein
MQGQDKNHTVSYLVVILFIAIWSPISGWAADLQVVCPSGGPGAYPSINAALNALDSQGPNSINVSGACTENIFLNNRERLSILGSSNQSTTIAAADPLRPCFRPSSLKRLF